MSKPDLSRVPDFFHKYINQVKEDDLMTAFNNQSASMFSFLSSIPKAKHDFAYDKDKWTIITEDGSWSAHKEHTILVTKDSWEIVTKLS